jgi:tRNA A37 methylthiotransferase MiaB
MDWFGRTAASAPFHLSLRAGDGLVLKRMKRPQPRWAVATVERLKAAAASTISADLISFPTSEEAALNSLKLLDGAISSPRTSSPSL